MSRINLQNPDHANVEQKALFDQINGAFGVVPNMFKAIGNSSAALESMWTSFGALGKGQLDAKLGEQIAVHIADINRCEYCLAAHTVLGQKAGATADEMFGAGWPVNECENAGGSRLRREARARSRQYPAVRCAGRTQCRI